MGSEFLVLAKAFLVENGVLLASVAAVVVIVVEIVFKPVRGLWRWFRRKAPTPPGPVQTAHVGGVSAEGDVNQAVVTGKAGDISRDVTTVTGGSAPTTGRDQYNYGHSTQDIVALARNLGVTEGAVNAFLRRIGETEVPAERIPQTLETMAERFHALQAEVKLLRAHTPEVAEPEVAAAEAAIEAGDFDEAERLLAQIGEAHDRAAAETWAMRGQVRMTTLRYRGAAAAYFEAAKRIPADDAEDWREHTRAGGIALRQLGLEFGDNAALAEAADVFRQMAERFPRAVASDHWADAQNLIGIASQELGSRESGAARLEEAVAAFRAALAEWTRERVPLDWAGTQNNLGNALQVLGERESGTARLEEAVAAFRAALQVYTQERVPLDWAGTQNNLGAALRALGERESGTARLEEAVAAYRAALQERTRERVPLDWAGTQGNLAGAFIALYEKTEDRRLLDQALECCALAEPVFAEAAPYHAEALARIKARALALRRSCRSPFTDPRIEKGIGQIDD